MAFNVTVLGAAGGIGQPLSLLLKQSSYVKRLVLFDVVKVVEGVAADLSHIETTAEVVGIAGDLKDPNVQKKQLEKALVGSEIVIIPAGIPRKPGMTRDDLFKINAGIVKGLIEGIAEHCPKAMICIISNPVNATVPIAAEVLKAKGVLNEKRLFGVSTLDIVRSNTFVASKIGKKPKEIDVTVIGGHSGVTILPLLSEYSDKLKEDDIVELTKRIRTAGTEVVEAKAGAGSATLSMGYAGARFAIALMKAMAGESGVTECAFVKSDTVPGVDYFASRISLGPNGVEKVLDIGKLSDYEQKLLENEVLPELKKSISKGIEFVTKS